MLDYLDDIESDLSAFHRIDDMYAMSGPRFFRFAERLPAYDGVMRVRATALAEGDNPGASTGTRSGGDAAPSPAQYSVGRTLYDTPEPITPLSIVSDPVLGSLFSYGTGPG